VGVALSGCHAGDPFNPDQCFFSQFARLAPADSRLNIGDTLTMHVAQWTAPPGCLPSDTTAASTRWDGGQGVVAIDATTGHLTALRPGLAFIYMLDGDAGAGASTSVGVYEPPGADSVTSVIMNHAPDSALFVLEDANGAVQRSQVLAARDSTCWVTPLSDSVKYSVSVYPAQGAAPPTAAEWVVHGVLMLEHTWYVTLYSNLGLEVSGRSPDPSTGC
jgi:hypothetical protein